MFLFFFWINFHRKIAISIRVWHVIVIACGQVESSVSDKPEGSEQTYNIMITTKTTLDNTSTAI